MTFKQLVKIVAEQHLAARALHLGDPVEGSGQIRAQFCHLSAGFLQQRPGGAALLVEQRRHQVHRLDVLIVATHRQGLGIGQCLLEFGRQLVHSHELSLEKTLGMRTEMGMEGRQFNGFFKVLAR